MKPTSTNAFPFLTGGGEMGELTRQLNWETTALGSPRQWPYSLRTSVSNILQASQPMLVLWGDDLTCFYNDAVIPSLGPEKHPAVGKPAREVWSEGWDFVGPLLDGVLTTGKPVSFQDAPMTFYRHNQIQEVYWTFSYSVILNDEGTFGGVLVNCLETTQAVRDRQALLRSQEQFQSLVSSAPVAIALFEGPQFVIELANKRVLEYWGRSREQVMHKPLFDALPESSGQGFEELLTDVYTTGERFVAKELTVTLERNGRIEPTYIDFVYEPFRQPDGTITGVLVICTEITEQVLVRRKIEESETRYRQLSEELDQQVQQRTLELAVSNEQLAAINQELTIINEQVKSSNRALEMANDDLIRSNQNLEQFAYIASHDLQEPLRKIQQFSDLLKTRYTSTSGEELVYLERMQTAAGRMSLLIKDLLTFSRITTGQATTEPVALDRIIQQALENLSVAVEESGAQVQVDPLPVVEGDASQLSQLFQNLLSNALKFRRKTTTGEAIIPQISLRTSRVPRSALPQSVHPTRLTDTYHQIQVTDNGIGFEEKYRDRIFQVFQRLHGKNEFAGTGVGLAIVQKVVTNHGGAIIASSNPGQGATFCVYLPA